jgi:nucleotide-binding universal stress UspA family protein
MTANVVVGYDGTPSSGLALDEAAREAEHRAATLAIIHAYHRGPMAYPPYETPGFPTSWPPADDAHDTAAQIAEQGAELVRTRHPGLTVVPKAVAGFPPTVLAEQSRDTELLVVGDRGRGGFAGLLLGTTALRTVSCATCPTMVVRGAAGRRRGRVLAAVDIADPSDEMLAFAFDEADRRKARLRAVSAWEFLLPYPAPGDAGQLRRAARQAAESVGVALDRLLAPWQVKFADVFADREVAEGPPGTVLTTATANADLLVVGAGRRHDGHGGMYLGPITHTVLLHAECPVAVVPRD